MTNHAKAWLKHEKVLGKTKLQNCVTHIMKIERKENKMKNLADVAKSVVKSVVIAKMKCIQLTEIMSDTDTAHSAMYGFVYADLYAYFEPDGKLSPLLDMALESFHSKKGKTEKSYLALIDKAFIEGYKAGFNCREKMNDEINFDE